MECLILIVISIINVKGGVGKTQCSINIAGQFAKQGYKVLLMDNDSQGNLSQILNIDAKYTMYEIYTDNKISISDCIQEYNSSIDVIPNTIESAILESKLHNKLTRETILRRKFESFRNDNKYDFVLIDNSPFLGLMTINSLSMSDYYLEVIDNSTSSLQGLKMVSNLIDDLISTGVNYDIKKLGILRNRFEKRSIFSKQFKEVTNKLLKDEIFETIIYDTVKFKEAAAKHLTIQEYDKKTAESFKNLHYEILSRIKSDSKED